jgi:hypothetical protein
MIRKRLGFIVLAISLCLAGYWLFSRSSQPTKTSKPVTAHVRDVRDPRTTPASSYPNAVDHPVLESTAIFQSNESTGERDYDIIYIAMGCFRKNFEGNPIGENEEIFAALRGRNPKGIRYLPDTFPGLQSDGKVNDRWGTPWRFHANSGIDMEVTSAGPDRTFGTKDDVGWNQQN